jgi:hypothetical protein
MAKVTQPTSATRQRNPSPVASQRTGLNGQDAGALGRDSAELMARRPFLFDDANRQPDFLNFPVYDFAAQAHGSVRQPHYEIWGYTKNAKRDVLQGFNQPSTCLLLLDRLWVRCNDGSEIVTW